MNTMRTWRIYSYITFEYAIDHLLHIGSWKKPIQEKNGLFQFRKSPYGLLLVKGFTLS